MKSAQRWRTQDTEEAAEEEEEVEEQVDEPTAGNEAKEQAFFEWAQGARRRWKDYKRRGAVRANEHARDVQELLSGGKDTR
jgi:hypothetical protein